MVSIDLDTFQQTIESSFFRHIRKKTLLPYEGELSKADFLADLHGRLLNGSYFVSSPRAFIVQSKEQKIARIVPVLALDDYCVYYFCIKQLEKYLAVNRVANTFGGFSLGGLIRKDENAQIEAMIDDIPSSGTRSYNRFGWMKSWGDYQVKAYSVATHSESTEFLFLDIANFYDTIDLDKLESKIRHAVPKEMVSVVNLLMSFLKNWNRKIYGYGHQTKGIPQDEVGDCSRILANFFLQQYDTSIFNLCQVNGVTYLRYADDQILMSDSRSKNLDMLYQASVLLHKEGLNVNASKVKEFDEDSFTRYWAFEIFSKLEDKNDRASVREGVEMYLSWYGDELGKESFRSHSVLSRILTVGFLDSTPECVDAIIAECLEDFFLLEANAYRMKRILDFMPDDRTAEVVDHLFNLASTARFGVYLYELLDLQRTASIFSDEQVASIKARIQEIAI